MPVSVPTFIKQAWAAVGTKFTIPDNANPTTGRAGWDQGFSPINLTPVAAGGIPPFGQDMNGVLYDITSAIQYIQAGRSFPYNQDFADAIGGYGKGSLVSLESDLSIAYKSKVDNNLTPPPSANWDVQGVIPAPTEPIQGSFKNLKLSSSGIDSLIRASADQIILENQSGATKKFYNINLSINSSSYGLNGLDSGQITGNTWYSVWLISNGTDVAGLISLSSASPTMPSGYSYKAKVWDIRTDSTANKFPLPANKKGCVTNFVPASGSNLVAYPVMASGVQGTISSPVSVNVSQYVPPTASIIKISIRGGQASGWTYASPSQALVDFNGANPPPLLIGGGGSQVTQIFSADWILLSGNVYFASNEAVLGRLMCLGWEE